MPDWIRLKDIVCYGYTGVLPEERTLGQRFVIDVDLQVDLQQAGGADRLEETVNYVELLAAIRTTVANESFYLIEALAETLASEIKKHEKVQQVRVQVCKPQPPIPDFTGSVCVEVWR
jgi:7,8-dihydroneopterin aldolase/epimerase/oxygenase